MIAAFVLTIVVEKLLRAGAMMQQDEWFDVIVQAAFAAWAVWVLFKVLFP